MVSWVFLDVLKAEHEARLRQAELDRRSADLKRAHGSPSVLKSLLLLFGRF